MSSMGAGSVKRASMRPPARCKSCGRPSGPKPGSARPRIPPRTAFCGVCEDGRARTWLQVSAPFLLPQGLRGHRCRWQCIDLDLAGCLDCGAVHSCEVGKCSVSEEEDSQVCTITGFCVRKKQFLRDEYMDTVVVAHANPSAQGEAAAFFEFREVQEKVHWMMASATARESFTQERARMEQKHCHLMWKFLRECKLHGRVPNLCRVLGQILNATNKIRVCPSAFEDGLREVVAQRCTFAISRFLNMLSQRFRGILAGIKPTTLVVGTLYLMRMGISMHSIVLLPRVPQLQLLLPIETHLKTYFRVKCKSITEVENTIKMCLRGLSPRDLERMGFTTVERE
eukprot:768525-Hanusia_phi.AAC.4